MPETRIQLCGPLVARIAGERIDDRLPGRQGRLLFAYLVLERRRPTTRDSLVELLWPGPAPEAAESALSALLSKLRRVVPVAGRSSVRIDLSPHCWVDLEAAQEALHRAEGAIAREDWTTAWGPARLVQHVCDRQFLPGEDAPWAEERRREAGSSLVRALELAGLASLRIGGGETATAERAARRLVELAPLRESGTRLLMEVLAAQGNRADALLVYDALRVRLHEELGIAPSEATQAAHRMLLG
ncbi:MAG: AfsR/SARP family transcriptional regulator [Gaiella sp.]